MIRKALEADIPAVTVIYDKLHTEEEAGRATIGWIRGVYPTEDTARQAFRRGDLFVQENGGKIVGAAIINQTQVAAYYGGPWQYAAEDSEIMVLHTLVIDPDTAGRGYGKQFVAFYEDYAGENGHLRLYITVEASTSLTGNVYKVGPQEVRVGYEYILKTSEFELTGLICALEVTDG